MLCKKSHSLLNSAAQQYINLGYQIGLCQKKSLKHQWWDYGIEPASWDSISIVLDGLVCVDLDRFTSLDKKYNLPVTLKERSPRGLHFFYKLPRHFRATSKVGWKKHIDLLTKDSVTTLYGKKPTELWQGHVLCSPSRGYSRLSPKITPQKGNLPMAPEWVLDALNR
jgi:hypothetical protein